MWIEADHDTALEELTAAEDANELCLLLLRSPWGWGSSTAAFPGREIHGVGDAAFHGEALICENSTWTTRLPANSVRYGPGVRHICRGPTSSLAMMGVWL